MPEMQIVLAGRAYPLGPLTLGSLRKGGVVEHLGAFKDAAKNAETGPGGTAKIVVSMDAMVTVVREAMVAGSKGALSRKQAEDLLDDGVGAAEVDTVLATAFLQVMDASKFTKPKDETGQHPGEAGSSESKS